MTTSNSSLPTIDMPGDATDQESIRATGKPSASATQPRQKSVTPTYAAMPSEANAKGAGQGERRVVFAQGNLCSQFQHTKRTFDFIGAMILVVMFSPIILGTFLVLMVTTRGRPIFSQQRVGLEGRLFPMLKFRTMRLDADKVQHLVKNEKGGPIFKNKADPRITRIGRILRKTSIDELPQLFNVLAGHMSLVGPRPPIAKEVVKYDVWQRRRLSVRPGLTCLWQVSGRCEVEFEDWVRMDLWYVKNQSFKTDLKLLAKTPLSVLSGRGAY